ncbi:hypothetical protein, partial [Lactobacillus delbrueckii]|uniref:hypothetical protein n=1 Tax=Lactobacillus delbrueckii TaxID=1584 RepID=UPI001E3F78C1
MTPNLTAFTGVDSQNLPDVMVSVQFILAIGEMLISQDFTTQAIRLTDFLPAVFLLCMTFQKCEDLCFSSGTF